MNGRAAPVVICNDRTHYLHEPADVGDLETSHITVGDGTTVSMYRWHATPTRTPSCVLNIDRAPFALYAHLTADELRLIAYAALQAASELDSETHPQKEAA